VNFLLDTMAISEGMKPKPNRGLARWLAETDEDRLFLSVVTFAEIRAGIERLAQGPQRLRLEAWLTQQLLVRFEYRIIPISLAISDAWGRITARCLASGRPIAVMDAFLAATAEVHAFSLVTRNVSHFSHLGVPLENPWNLQ
jgi:toxin FitB